jgi:hypothetical protein
MVELKKELKSLIESSDDINSLNISFEQREYLKTEIEYAIACIEERISKC